MSSYEQRIKAVELYIQIDKSPAVITELGYPTAKMLRSWYKEYMATGDLHKKFRLGYTAEQRLLAVNYYLKHGRSIARTVRALGYPSRQLLGEWIHEDLPSNCIFKKREVWSRVMHQSPYISS